MVGEISKSAPGVDYAYGRWVVRNRWIVLLMSIAVFAIAASGARYLTMNPDARVFFSKDNPHLLALEQLENTYAKLENLLFVLEVLHLVAKMIVVYPFF